MERKLRTLCKGAISYGAYWYENKNVSIPLAKFVRKYYHIPKSYIGGYPNECESNYENF